MNNDALWRGASHITLALFTIGREPKTESDIADAPSLPPIYPYGGLHTSSPASPHISNMPTAMNAVPEPLRLAASAANELQSIMPVSTLPVDHELPASAPGVPEHLFHAHGRLGGLSSVQAGSIDPSLQDHTRELSAAPSVGQELASQMAPTYAVPAGVNTTTPTQTHFTSGFSVNQKPIKPKVRGRFSDSRRKEVQDVRKKGACIRCRMLKKPVGSRSNLNITLS